MKKLRNRNSNNFNCCNANNNYKNNRKIMNKRDYKENLLRNNL